MAKILIVDDDAYMPMTIKNDLARSGYQDFVLRPFKLERLLQTVRALAG